MERIRKNKFYIIVTALLTLSPMFIGILLYDRLPEQIPTHFDFNGEVNQYSSKNFVIFFLGIFLFVAHMFCIFVTLQDPKRKNISDKIFRLILWICPILGLYLSFIIYGNALGMTIDISISSMLFVGLIFIIIGNYLPKCKQNYTVGIKCPWTLNDKENWESTHRFSGYLYVLCGIIFIIISFFIKNSFVFYVLLGLLVIVSVLPFLYSYLFYKKHLKAE